METNVTLFCCLGFLHSYVCGDYVLGCLLRTPEHFSCALENITNVAALTQST